MRTTLKVTALCALVAGVTAGAAIVPVVVSPAMALTTCDPAAPGCTFEADGTSWHTDADGIAWPACADEDSAGPCYWDAHAMGNGTGTSFYVVDGTILPWS